MTVLDDGLLNISYKGRVLYGVDQEFYPQSFQKKAGCGAATFANVLIYGMRSGLIAPVLTAPPDAEDALIIMQKTWRHLTPGMMGLHTTSAYCKGAAEYSEAYGIDLNTRALDISAKNRPGTDITATFIHEGLKSGMPVAFLNLSRGAVKPLESWHWVTVTGIEGAVLTAADNGNKISLDLDLWLKTTRIGGGFVSHYLGGKPFPE